MPAAGELVLHHLNASRSKRVLWLLEELGAPYSVRAYLRVRGRAPPELTAVHPLGKSPVLTDGGEVVAESGHIVEHLLETRDAGRVLQPAADDTAGRAAHSYFLHYVEGSLSPLLLMDVVLGAVVDATPWPLRPVTRGVRDAVYANFVGPELDRHAAYLEGVLASRDYIACARFTAADTHLHSAVEAMLGGDRALARAAASPRLAAYCARLKERPAYLRATAKDKELEMK